MLCQQMVHGRREPDQAVDCGALLHGPLRSIITPRLKLSKQLDVLWVDVTSRHVIWDSVRYVNFLCIINLITFCNHPLKPVYSRPLLSPALCGIMWSWIMCPSSTQAIQPPCPSHLRLGLLAAFRGMDLDGTHQEDARIFKFMIRRMEGCRTMNLSIAIYLLTSIIFLWNTPQISYLLSIDCYNLFRLINHNSRIIASVCAFITLFWLRCRQ